LDWFLERKLAVKNENLVVDDYKYMNSLNGSGICIMFFCWFVHTLKPSGTACNQTWKLKQVLISFYVSFSFPVQVASHILMGIPHSASSSPLSPFGEACLRKDLTAIHEILDNIGYKDDQGVANEVLYFLWKLK